MQVKKKDFAPGDFRPPRVQVSPDSLPQGAVAERKTQDRALLSQFSEEHLAEAFHGLPVSIVILRLSDRRIVYANDSFLQLSRFTQEEVIGRSEADLQTWVNLEDRERAFEALNETESLHIAETLMRGKRGVARSIRLSGRLINFGGEQCVIVIMEDVTDTRHLQIKLAEAHRMESIGRLAAGVAHDFNNVLAVIHGNASLLLLEPDLAPGVQNSLEEICSSVDRAAALTRSLLALGRRHPLHFKTIDLNRLVENQEDLFIELACGGIKVEFELTKPLPTVRADAAMLEQVIFNLVTNARDAMPAGGVLKCTTDVFQVDDNFAHRQPAAAPGPHVRLVVEDSGCGIEELALPHVFEPFFTTKEFGKGKGLGLAVAYGIVRQHKGWIDVTSTPGKGSVFTVYLPVRENLALHRRTGPGTGVPRKRAAPAQDRVAPQAL